MSLIKKLSAGLLTLTMCAAFTATAFADEAQTTFNLYVPNDPTYTITVPATIQLNTEDITDVPVTASDVKYIPEGKEVSVTYKRGSGVFGRFYLTAENPDGGKALNHTLYIKGTDGEWKMGALEKKLIGTQLAAFTEDGTANYEVKPAHLEYPNSASFDYVKGAEYSAWMTYGIELVDITAE